MTGALLVFAKEPRAGAVKTRLCPPFTPEQAASFYESLLADVLEMSARAAARLRLAPILCATPPEACERMARRAPAGFRTLAQRGPGLAARMEAALVDAAALGHAPLLLRGSDSPLLGEESLAAALAALGRAELVLGPDRDGGYQLVGLRRPAPGLFDHPMSTASVLDDTLARAAELGLTSELLAPSFDIDRAADLALLAEARAAGQARACPRTLAWLDRRALWG